MYNAIVQDILNSIYGGGQQQGQQQQRQSVGGKLRSDIWDKALADASGGILSSNVAPVDNRGPSNQTFNSYHAPEQTQPTQQTGGAASSDEELIGIISSLLGGGATQPTKTPVQPIASAISGGGVNSLGGMGGSSGGLGSLGASGSGSSQRLPSATGASAITPSRDGGFNTGQTNYTPTNVLPGGGFSIRYGARP